ncbi:MAG TPA: hypothetical protein VFK35_10145 [Candidatus Limnocylindrales bacterium]|nr:hypothetical protein [Candidatus Limnocylindrales bacterium]
MPTRRTSPRRSATRPRVLGERLAGLEHDATDVRTGGQLAAAAPWLALLAVILAGAALAVAFVGRTSGGDLTACRSAAWSAIPAAEALPAGWTLGSSDLNANGMTVSIVGPAPADGATSQAVVYASVTCYGEAAATALDDNRRAAEAAGASVIDRTPSGQAYDVDNPSTGSLTTLFRVGGLIGQIADAGSATPTDLAAITRAVAAAMGDQNAAGALGSDSGQPGASDEPAGSLDGETPEPAASAFAPELEALMPRDVKGTPLTVQSAAATEVFGDDPSSRALAARIRTLGGTIAELQIAQAFDETGGLDVSIIGFRLPGADEAKLRDAIVETWLSAGNEGVTQAEITLGGRKLIRVDYGDEGTTEYVYAKGDTVIVIDTADPSIAEDIAAKLK